MSEVHIYTAAMQPATCFVDHNMNPPYTFRWSPHMLIYVECCDKRRRAANCVVQVYYDHLAVWCAPNKGCKSQTFIEKKRRREFRNRSRAQRARFRKPPAPTGGEGGEK